MKSVVKGIEVISNKSAVEHEEFCEVVSVYIREVFDMIPNLIMNDWIKRIDYTMNEIGNKECIYGQYNSENKIIYIADKGDNLLRNISLYHEIVHARIFYENKDTYKEMVSYGYYWNQLNEYKTIVSTYVNYIKNRVTSNEELIKLIDIIQNQILNSTCYLSVIRKVSNDCGKYIEENPNDKEKIIETYHRVMKENDVNEEWYEVAKICGHIYTLYYFKELFPENVSTKIEELYSEFIRCYKLLKCDDFRYKIVQENIDLIKL